MKNLSRFLITVLTLSAFSFSLKAQVVSPAETSPPNDNYDPIVATLDSLVNQNYIQRLNFASSGDDASNDFKPFDIPSYSDAVYRSRMAKIQSPIELTYNSQVRDYIDMYAIRKRQLTARVLGLTNLYFPLFEQVLDQQGLPLELKYLSIVESALNPAAVSRCGATGLWQFMFNTGRLYNLKVNSYIDERRDPEKATYAACQYFKNMYEIYHDWLLVIAAYNCGPGNVNRAIVRSGGKTSFWEISPYLPRETRGYVPAFIAVTYLMNYTAEHNIVAVPPVISYYEADTVYIDNKASFAQIASALDMPVELLQYLNPIYKKNIIPDGDDSYVLRLPTNKITAFLNNCDKICPAPNSQMGMSNDGDSSDPTMFISRVVKKYHIVKSKETLTSISSKYSCSMSEIKRWNKMKGSHLFKGQKLLVYANIYEKAEPRAKANSDSQNVSQGEKNSNPAQPTSTDTTKKTDNAPEGSSAKIIFHVVAPGDTLWNIAHRYDVSVEKLKEINNLNDTDPLKPGTKLKVAVNG